MYLLVICGYLAVAALCVTGVLSPAYRDNTLQRVGMSALCLGALAEATEIGQARYASPGDTMLCIGLVAFSLGFAQKVWRHAVPQFKATHNGGR